jgi:hypothetical protein
LALEELLEEEIEEHGGAETVGLVFVERRITAMALHDYFRYREIELSKNKKWSRAIHVRKAYLQQQARLMAPSPRQKQHVSEPLQGGHDQFDDADGDYTMIAEHAGDPPPPSPLRATSVAVASAPLPAQASDQFMDADEDEDDLFDIPMAVQPPAVPSVHAGSTVNGPEGKFCSRTCVRCA